MFGKREYVGVGAGGSVPVQAGCHHRVDVVADGPKADIPPPALALDLLAGGVGGAVAGLDMPVFHRPGMDRGAVGDREAGDPDGWAYVEARNARSGEVRVPHGEREDRGGRLLDDPAGDRVCATSPAALLFGCGVVLHGGAASAWGTGIFGSASPWGTGRLGWGAGRSVGCGRSTKGPDVIRV